jgi:zinc finger SWIM domain-containing protein 3
MYAIENTFETRTIKSDSHRYRVCCKAEHCPWHLYARPLGDSVLWRIHSLQLNHECMEIPHAGNSSASAEFLASLIIEKVRTQPNIRPIDIQKDVHREHGIEIPYSRALAAKEWAFQMINGTHEESYAKLPQYCKQLLIANPGSFIEHERTDTNQFSRLFLCFHASAAGFVSCKPLVGLDGTSLKNKYQGILLTATATDAQGQLFPVAFGIADIEDTDNWLWFLRKLRQVFNQYC